MSTLTVRIDDELDRKLTEMAREKGRSKSELVREMLRRQAALDALRRVREALLPYGENAGYLSDEDFFRDFS